MNNNKLYKKIQIYPSKINDLSINELKYFRIRLDNKVEEIEYIKEERIKRANNIVKKWDDNVLYEREMKDIKQWYYKEKETDNEIISKIESSISDS